MEETIIISLGGSLIVPDGIDVEFLQDFRKLILAEAAKGKKFVIITGGGRTNTTYNEAAKKITHPSNEDLDWIGIAALSLNAELLRVIFGQDANDKVVSNLSIPFSFEKNIVIGSAYEPGKSTDWDAVLAAKHLGAKKIINLSNIDYVYDSDPKKNPNAQKIDKISWSDYRKIIPEEWISRLNSPFDPVASKMAQSEGMQVVIMNGKPIDNLNKCLNGGKFPGTVIS